MQEAPLNGERILEIEIERLKDFKNNPFKIREDISIDSGLASTLHFTYPVAVVLLTAGLFHERIGRKELLCAALCMGGILMLYKPGSNTGLCRDFQKTVRIAKQ